VVTRKSEEKPAAEESQVVLEQAGPAVPVFNDGVGEDDEKVNPAQDELQERVDEAERKGYLGVEADPTPDRHYTVEGVTSGLPTPETDRGNA
jgi:hypothetical protein